MKSLKESMRRFKTKNLNESETQEISETEALNEYTVGSAAGHNVYYNGKIKGDAYVLKQMKYIKKGTDFNEANKFVKDKSGNSIGYFIMYDIGVSSSTRQAIYTHLDSNGIKTADKEGKPGSTRALLPDGFDLSRGTTGEKFTGFFKDIGKTMNPKGSKVQNPYTKSGEFKN